MDNIWFVFDRKKENKVSINELRTIMRALDVNVEHPSTLHQIKEMIDPEKTGFITYDGLTLVMEDKLKETDTVDDLVA